MMTLHIGVLKAESGHLTEAISLFQKVISIDPTHATARRHLEQAKLQANSDKSENTSHLHTSS